MSFEIKKFDDERQSMIDSMRSELIELINPVMNHISKFGDSRERHNAISRFEEAISWLDKCIVMYEPAAPANDEVVDQSQSEAPAEQEPVVDAGSVA